MIHVGLSEIKFAQFPENLKSMGLGSCVGVILYPEKGRLAGMAHVMLPDSSLARSESFQPGKYADTAIPELIRIFAARGFSAQQLKAKIAGGAEMFKSVLTLPMGSIGSRNIEAVHRQLSYSQIPILGEETGDHFGRTIEFLTGTNRLLIRAISQKERII